MFLLFFSKPQTIYFYCKNLGNVCRKTIYKNINIIPACLVIIILQIHSVLKRKYSYPQNGVSVSVLSVWLLIALFPIVRILSPALCMINQLSGRLDGSVG